MSTLVLARKHRPRSFAQMVGQEHVVQALANALAQKRLHHAYLFTGTRGVGKTTVSRILAKSLNCTGPDGQGGITAEPCGVCDACREIDAGRFVDYVELDAASNRGVEEISTLLDQAVYKPVVGRFKVYLIDEVHMLSTHAFNAMLKTLEEPPEYLKFVLATTDPQKVPPTVLSRCLQFNLRPMAPQTIETHLARVLEEEAVPAEPGALRLLARAARGSMRDALSLADQAIAYGAGTLAEAGVRQMLGAVDRGHAVRIVEALAASDGAALVAAADALRALGLSAASTLEELATLLQQMALAQAVPGALDERDPEAAAAQRLAGLLPADEIQLVYSMALHGRAELVLAPDEYGGLVMVLLRMLAFRPAPAGSARRASSAQAAASGAAVVTAAARAAVAAQPTPPRDAPASPGASTPLQASSTQAAQRPLRAQASSQSSPAQAPSQPPPVGASSPSPPPQQQQREAASRPLRSEPMATDPVPSATRARTTAHAAAADRWNDAVARLLEEGSIGAMVRELAVQSQCVDVASEGDVAVWRLRVEREVLRAPAHREKLQAALAQSLGRPVRLDVEAGAVDDTPATRAAAARDRRQREAEAVIHNDPLVQALMSQYKTARIVPGSIKPQ